MIKDVTCPYCGKWNEVCNDDGWGCEEDRLYDQMCEHCGNTFVFTVSWSVDYAADFAPCLNGGPHGFKPQTRYGLKKEDDYTVQKCAICEKEIKE